MSVSFSRISLIFVGLVTPVGRGDTSVNAVPIYCLSHSRQYIDTAFVDVPLGTRI